MNRKLWPYSNKQKRNRKQPDRAALATWVNKRNGGIALESIYAKAASSHFGKGTCKFALPVIWERALANLIVRNESKRGTKTCTIVYGEAVENEEGGRCKESRGAGGKREKTRVTTA